MRISWSVPLLALLGCNASLKDSLGLPLAPKSIVGTCAGAAFSTIQAAIDAAASGDTVVICDGTFHEQLTITGKNLTIRSQNGAAWTTIDADHHASTLTIAPGAGLLLDGVTLTDGYTTGDGGNIACTDATLTIVDSQIQDAQATRGAGMSAVRCILDVSETTFIDNTTRGSEGGAGAWIEESTGTVATSRFEGNSGHLGGGIHISGGTLILQSDELVGNSAEYGGGIYLGGDASLTDVLLDGNTGDWHGGGIYAHYFSGEIVDSTFSDNVTGGDGGGLYLVGGTAVVRGNTFDRNEAGDDAGGLRVKYASWPIIEGNVFTGNISGALGGGAKVSHGSVISSGNTYSANTAGWGGGGLSLDLAEAALSGETFTGNLAQYGGGLHMGLNSDVVSVEDSTFTSNEASQQGGNVTITGPGALTTFVRVAIVGGTAPRGGGLYASGADIDIVNTLIASNTGTSAGGGMLLNGCQGSIVNVVAWRNAGLRGSAMRITSGGALLVANSIVGRNTSSSAVVVTGGVPPTWQYNDMSGNSGDFTGMADPGAGLGNLHVSPGFSRPGVYTLGATSPLIDAGDVSIHDADGSPSDMGMYGGPEGAGW